MVFGNGVSCIVCDSIFAEPIFSLSNLDCKAELTVSSLSILILVYACVIVVLYRVDIEVMSRAGFKCRASSWRCTLHNN